MSSSRQLAAIMFTDIVGYTALMGNDEQKAFDLLSKNRQLQKSIIEQFNGRWIKELGDGVMASFNTVSDAVTAAIKIQEACKDANHYQLRIGIHLGEVVFENDDVFGDGVNLASRIQSVSAAGCIYISEPVYQNIVNKKDFQAKFVKEEKLKNVADRVKIYEVFTAVESSASVMKAALNKSMEKSIAVLPFVNMSNDPEQEYFSDGMAEEILNSLSHLKDLKVAGRTSSFQFKGQNMDLREVGNKLTVKNVLAGSVRKHGNRIRITAQLINVDDGFNLWSEKYERELDDVFAIQDEIALAITEKLKITLLDNDISLITKTHTQNTTAHNFYLKGRYEWGKRTREGFLNSIDYYNQAILEDAEYSLAYAGKADSYTLLCGYHILSPEACMSNAKTAAMKAIELNPDLAEAYEAIGHIEFLSGFDWKKAEDNYLKAIDLNPGFATAHQRYALMLAAQERFHEALKEILQAQELDPLSMIINTDVALIHLLMGNTEMSIDKCKLVLERDPAFSVALFIEGLAYEQNAKRELAVSNFEQAVRASKNNPIAKSALAHALAKSGNKTEALKILKEMEASSGLQFVSPYCLAIIYSGLGLHDEVFHNLNKAIDMNSVWMIHLHFSSDLRFKALKKDIRWSALLKRIQSEKE